MINATPSSFQLGTGLLITIAEVFLNSSGDVELASMDAGVAEGKPGDTFSIADSALGRSSVVTDTTAGVTQTQFSEVVSQT